MFSSDIISVNNSAAASDCAAAAHVSAASGTGTLACAGAGTGYMGSGADVRDANSCAPGRGEGASYASSTMQGAGAGVPGLRTGTGAQKERAGAASPEDGKGAGAPVLRTGADAPKEGADAEVPGLRTGTGAQKERAGAASPEDGKGAGAPVLRTGTDALKEGADAGAPGLRMAAGDMEETADAGAGSGTSRQSGTSGSGPRIGARELSLCACFTALIAVCTFIKIPIPPIPITMQLFATVLAGLVLGPKLGMLSCTVYIVLGLLGVPVFTGGGGIGYVFNPTFGFIVGFIFGTGLTGCLARRLHRWSVLNLCLVSYAGLVIVYVLGVAYYMVILNLYLGKPVGIMSALISCYFVFIPGDILKCILASVIAKRLVPVIGRM